MASFLTNRGKKIMQESFWQNTNVPTAFKLALITSAAVPTVDTDLFSELTEIAGGNGYTTGGIAVARNTTDFINLAEDDGANLARIFLASKAWTASGGPIPASGNAAAWAILKTDEATPQVVACLDLGGAISVSATQSITIANTELQLTEPA